MGKNLLAKNAQNPFVVSVGDKVFYLKEDGVKTFWSGCAFVTDIFVRSTRKIITLEGSAIVDDVTGVLVATVEEKTEETYKLYLKTGQFTYSYENWLNTVVGAGNTKQRDDDVD